MSDDNTLGLTYCLVMLVGTFGNIMKINVFTIKVSWFVYKGSNTLLKKKQQTKNQFSH